MPSRRAPRPCPGSTGRPGTRPARSGGSSMLEHHRSSRPTAGGGIELIVAPEPMMPRVKRLQTPADQTVGQLLAVACNEADLPFALVRYARVYVDGLPIDLPTD